MPGEGGRLHLSLPVASLSDAIETLFVAHSLSV